MIPLVLPIAEWILDYPKPANNEFDGDTALTLILIDLEILVNQRLAGVRGCELDQLRFLLLLGHDEAIAR